MLSFSGFSYQRQQERDRKEIKHMKNRLHVKAPGNWVNDPNGMIFRTRRAGAPCTGAMR